MIDRQNVIDLVDQYLLESESESYVVDVAVSRDNAVVVTIDNDEGVNIDECEAISGYLNDRLDRDVEDYELEVGSAGLTSPLRTTRQFAKYEGEPVVVSMKDGRRLRGTLGKADDEGFDLTTTQRIKPEGAKKKVEVTETQHIARRDTNSVVYDL